MRYNIRVLKLRDGEEYRFSTGRCNCVTDAVGECHLDAQIVRNMFPDEYQLMDVQDGFRNSYAFHQKNPDFWDIGEIENVSPAYHKHLIEKLGVETDKPGSSDFIPRYSGFEKPRWKSETLLNKVAFSPEHQSKIRAMINNKPVIA